MKHRVSFLGVCIVLAGCAQAQIPSPPVTQPQALPALAHPIPPTPRPGRIEVFASGSSRASTFITRGEYRPFSLAMDASGTLYVSNVETPRGGPGNVEAYAQGDRRPARTLAKGVDNPYTIALGPGGTLYVANEGQPNSISEYAHGTRLQRTFGVAGIPAALAFDAAGNLYVALAIRYGGEVAVYAPGATKPEREITAGIHGPMAMVFDASGNLYVANADSRSVSVYAPGSTRVTRTLLYEGAPVSLLADNAGNVYVGVSTPASGLYGSIVVIDASGGTLKIPGIGYPVALVVDGAGNLYVADADTSLIGVYAPSATSPSRVIEEGVSSLRALAVDAKGDLYVAEEDLNP